MALAIVIGVVAVTIAILVTLGREPKGARMGSDVADEAALAPGE